MRQFRVYRIQMVKYLDPWGSKVPTAVPQVVSTKTLRETDEMFTFHNGYSDVYTPVCRDWFGQRYVNVASGVGYYNPARYKNLDDIMDPIWVSSLSGQSLNAGGYPINHLGERVSDIPVRIAE